MTMRHGVFPPFIKNLSVSHSSVLNLPRRANAEPCRGSSRYPIRLPLYICFSRGTRMRSCRRKFRPRGAPRSFCQRLALHLFEVRLISANRVAGHVELRRLVGDEQPCILVKEQSEAEAVVPYAHLERISEFFRAHGEDIIYVPVGDVRLGVKIAVSLFAGVDFRSPSVTFSPIFLPP